MNARDNASAGPVGSTAEPLLITGANGHLGRRLIASLPPERPVRAIVRSPRARQQIEKHVPDRPGLQIAVLDPADAAALAEVATGCGAAVHLIGTIRESRAEPYEHSHQRPVRALIEAAGRVALKQLVYVSILGAGPQARSRCLRARAAVETLLDSSPIPAAVLRVPMVLGEGDRASRALRRQVARRRAFTFRSASLEQPIYAGDVIDALQRIVALPAPQHAVWELAGPTSLTRKALLHKAAECAGTDVEVVSLPLALGLAATWFMARIRTGGGPTPDMLRVLDHDDSIDPGPAARELGIELTSLEVMLQRCMRPADALPVD